MLATYLTVTMANIMADISPPGVDVDSDGDTSGSEVTDDELLVVREVPELDLDVSDIRKRKLAQPTLLAFMKQRRV